MLQTHSKKHTATSSSMHSDSVSRSRDGVVEFQTGMQPHVKPLGSPVSTPTCTWLRLLKATQCFCMLNQVIYALWTLDPRLCLHSSWAATHALCTSIRLAGFALAAVGEFSRGRFCLHERKILHFHSTSRVYLCTSCTRKALKQCIYRVLCAGGNPKCRQLEA